MSAPTLRCAVGVLGLVAACGAPAEGPASSVLLAALEPMPLDAAVEARVDALLAQLTLEEKVAEMHGTSILPVKGAWPVAANPRLGIPALIMADGPRGTTATKATSFPVGMARGATWDPELERRVGEAIGLEAAAAGVNVVLAPVVNLTTHPRYGRAQETYGEDPWLTGRMGVAFVQGLQPHALASVKHLAVNNIENSRFEVDAVVAPEVLRETFLPQFEAVVREADVASVMSAYNKLNGDYCGENRELLTGILKEDWGFQGWVESDWINGTHDAKRSVEAGLDIEMPVDKTFDALAQRVERGEVDVAAVDGAVRRILRRKLEYGLDAWAPPGREVIRAAEHIALAKEVALRGTVLLRNEGALPLASSSTLGVVGRLADLENLGDTGSSDVPVVEVVTVLEGLVAALGAGAVTHVGADTLTPADREALAALDAVVVVVGLTDEEEGEFIPGKAKGDRQTLGLSEAHVALVREVASVNDRVIVVLEGGSAITVEEWIDDVEGVVHAWYPGEQGGAAVADLLLGLEDFRGRLPLVVPTGSDQLPPFDNVSLSVDYPAFHGQRHLDARGTKPRFPLAYGLTYASFQVSGLEVTGELEATPDGAGSVSVSVKVQNTGSRASSELVTVWLTPPGGVEPRRLVGFGRVDLEAGASGSVTVALDARSVARWDEGERAWRVSAGSWVVEAGPHAGDLPLTGELVVTVPVVE